MCRMTWGGADEDARWGDLHSYVPEEEVMADESLALAVKAVMKSTPEHKRWTLHFATQSEFYPEEEDSRTKLGVEIDDETLVELMSHLSSSDDDSIFDGCVVGQINFHTSM